MADLTSADVTITVQERRIENKKRIARVKIVFGDGSKTYPTGGVPMPAYSSFGMVRNLESLVLIDPDDASGIVWKYDFENKKLRAYIQAVDVSAAGAVTMDDFPINTTNEPLATASLSVSLNNNAGTGTKYLGRLKELVNTQAPAAHTMYAQAIGW